MFNKVQILKVRFMFFAATPVVHLLADHGNAEQRAVYKTAKVMFNDVKAMLNAFKSDEEMLASEDFLAKALALQAVVQRA